MRNLFVVGFLFALIIISFLLWGSWFEDMFQGENAVIYLQNAGPWAWVLGLVLLIGDLFLPLPATLIMSALGYIYGPVTGGLMATIGTVCSGLLAYGLCRSVGVRGALFILGKKDLENGRKLFTNRGGWIVAISRWLPMVPEVVACMAGLNRMPFKMFSVALICGSIPLAFVFAFIGYRGHQSPVAAVVISAVFPAILWLIAQYFLRKKINPGK